MSTEETEKGSESQAVLDSRLIERFETHRDFTRVFLDAFILLSSQRKVLKFNQMFCSVIGMKAIDVRRANVIDELLVAEIEGSSKSAIDILLESEGPVRIDEVHAKKTASGEEMNLIISSYPYLDTDGKLLGACVLMRDVTAESNLQGKYKEKTIQSITDVLTGLFTRRFFEDWLDKEIERCKARARPLVLGVLMFDLDKFKNINDGYGHQAGDYVLAETAKVLRTHSRKSDILGRYGGEELLVLLVGSDAHGCCVAAEKFREAIFLHDYIFEGKKIPVSTSIGLSMFLNGDESRESVVARADKCLYAAKHNGRNLVYANFGQGEIKATDYIAAFEAEAQSLS